MGSALLAWTVILSTGCEKDRTPTAVESSGGLSPEQELEHARQAARRGEWQRAFRMGFEGYMTWLRRTRGRAGRADRYASVVHHVLEQNGPRTLLDRCVAVRTNFEEKACNRVFVDHLRRGTSGPEARQSARRVYREACLERRPGHLADGCAGLPLWLALDPETGPQVMGFLRKRCVGRKERPGRLCAAVILAAWEAAFRRVDGATIEELGAWITSVAGHQGAVRLLYGLADKRADVTSAVSRAFLQNVGTTEGLSQLANAFTDSLGPELRKMIVERYIDRLEALVPELVTVLSMAEESESAAVLDAVVRVGGPRARKLAQRVRSVLTEPRDLALKAYLKAAVDDPALRRKAVRSLAGRRDVLRAQVIAQLAGADFDTRTRYRRLLRELEPEAAFGSVEGRILRGATLDQRRLNRCRVQLVERRTCDGSERTVPDPRGRTTELSSAGSANRVTATVDVDGRGRYRFARIPAGPYDIFVKCPGLDWRRFVFAGYVRKGRNAEWVNRCLLTVPSLRTVTALTLDVDVGRPVLPIAPLPGSTQVGPAGARRGRRSGKSRPPPARPRTSQ